MTAGKIAWTEATLDALKVLIRTENNSELRASYLHTQDLVGDARLAYMAGDDETGDALVRDARRIFGGL